MPITVDHATDTATIHLTRTEPLDLAATFATPRCCPGTIRLDFNTQRHLVTIVIEQASHALPEEFLIDAKTGA